MSKKQVNSQTVNKAKTLNNLLGKITDPSNHFTGEHDAPTHLYHYTNADALKNIISGKSFWLFDIRYLNDESEYVHIFDFAADYAMNQETRWIEGASTERSALFEEVTDFYNYDTEQTERFIEDLYSATSRLKLTDKEIELKTRLTQYVRGERRGNKKWPFYSALSSAISNYVEGLIHVSPACYVTSFSQKRDQLSQWRGYCSDGGYSIGFNAMELSRAVSPDFVVGRCRYTVSEKRRLLDSIFASFYTDFKTLYSSGMKINHGNPKRVDFYNVTGLSEDIWDKRKKQLKAEWLAWQKKVGLGLARFAPFFKHKGFKEEEEWRFVNASSVFPESFHEPIKDFYPNQTTLRPFTVMSFAGLDFDNQRPWEPLIEVTVGPMSNQELAKKSILVFLEQHLGSKTLPYSNNTVKISDIPYRTG